MIKGVIEKEEEGTKRFRGKIQKGRKKRRGANSERLNSKIAS